MAESTISDAAREREFYRYYTPRAESETPEVARSSNDASLTAFAQLGALRFNAKRCFISLFDRQNQYILAEATRTISLQTDSVHHEGDELRYGQAISPRNCDTPYPCDFAFNAKGSSVPDGADESERVPPHFMVKDISRDERFKELMDENITRIENRFYCGVPIITPKGINIGTLAIFDDRPREFVDKALLQFLTDVAKTIMQHLELKRLKKNHRRGERMVRGLASFVDGKASIRESHAGGNLEAQETDRPVYRSEGRLDANQQDEDRKKEKKLQEKKPSRPGSLSAAMRMLSSEEVPTKKRRTTVSEVTFVVQRDNPQEGNIEDTAERMLSRAMNLIRESAEVEGAVIFDAKISSFGGMVEDTESSRSRSSSSNSHSDESQESISSTSTSRRLQEQALCEILGFSTTETSSINSQHPPECLGSLRQVILKRWLSRYKYGRVFNFDQDGSFSENSSGEDNGSALSGSSTKSYYQQRSRLAKTTSSRRREDAETLIRMCPGARSIAILPLRDAKRDAWYAGLLVWTRSPHRGFSVNEDLGFLAAFGNSIMAEADRIDSRQRDQAKTDLLSSISHELRSPCLTLHGILGGVEILAEIPNMTTLQSNMIYTIETCGKTLLDIMDHLLDFTKINAFNKGTQRKTIEKPSHVSEARQGQRRAIVRDLTSDCDIGLMTEEVIEAIAAGQSRLGISVHNDIDGAHGVHIPLGSVVLIIDIQPIHNAYFALQAGAWRRIVMNLLANSLKYTFSGYIAVTLTIEESDYRGGAPRGTIAKLTVNDSGKGISQQFLRERIFQAFTQENELNPGTGLGLNLVKKVVTALKGDIHIESEKGAFTNVTVTVPLVPVATPPDTLDQLLLSSLCSRMKGLTLHMVGFDATVEHETEAEAARRCASSSSKAHQLFKDSLQRLCKDTLEMNVISTRNIQEVERHEIKPDLCLVHPAITSNGHLGVLKILDQMNADPFKQSAPPVPIVFLCDKSSTAVALETATSRSERSIQYLALPCGPRKVMRAFTSALDRHTLTLKQPQPLDKPPTYRPPTFPKSHSEDSETTSPLVIDNADYVSSLVRKLSTKQTTPSRRTMPRTPVKEREETSPTVEAELKASHAKILLVDDNPINLRLLEAFAKKNKYSYGRATNGLEAFELFKGAPTAFRVVLMDISMPIMDGLESTRAIRSHERTLSVTNPAMIIALTGVGSGAIQQEAFASGVNLFLTKPVRFAELSKILKGAAFGGFGEGEGDGVDEKMDVDGVGA